MESDASVHNRVEDACARDCRRTPKALFQFEQALQLLLQSGTVFRGIVEIAEPCLFQWRQHDYNVLLKAYEFEGKRTTSHIDRIKRKATAGLNHAGLYEAGSEASRVAGGGGGESRVGSQSQNKGTARQRRGRKV